MQEGAGQAAGAAPVGQATQAVGRVVHEPLRTGRARRPVGFGLWLALYVSGAALVVLVLAHLVAEHYLVPAGGLRAASVQQRLAASLWWWVVDLGLLVGALVHGLAGVYRLLDEGGYLPGGWRWVVALGLTAVGAFGLKSGVEIFQAFLAVR